MKFKWIAAFLLIVALGLATAALAASNDNNVEWNGTGHTLNTNICGDVNYPYRNPAGTPASGQDVIVRARAYWQDLTGMTIWYTTNAAAAVQGDWSSVAATWEANWWNCGGIETEDMDIYKGTIPGQSAPRVWYKIEYIDGTDHDWRRGRGEGANEFYDDDGGWTTGSTSLTYGQTISRCEPEWARVPNNQLATVCIYVQNAGGLYGADFEMSFPGMVGIATVVDEDVYYPDVQILPNMTFMSPPWNIWFNTVDNSVGSLHYLVFEQNPSTPKTGSGPIACMRFDSAGKVGTFDMAFQPILSLTGHDLLTRDGFLMDDIAHTCRVTFYDPTAVVLSRFEAWPVATGIHVQWETVEEIDNLGFNLYRSTTLEGSKVKLNRALIPTKNPGSPVGAVYDWVDIFWLSRGRSYFYWLEDVDIYGHTTMHGPAKLRPTLKTVE